MVQAEIVRIGERRRSDRGGDLADPLPLRRPPALRHRRPSAPHPVSDLRGRPKPASPSTSCSIAARAARPPAARAPAAALCTLPGQIADFTGREPEIADLVAALCREDRRAAVSAIGGMAAPARPLAIEAAWRMAGRFPDGILYVDMLGFGTAPPLTSAQAISAVIQELEPTANFPDRSTSSCPATAAFSLAGSPAPTR